MTTVSLRKVNVSCLFPHRTRGERLFPRLFLLGRHGSAKSSSFGGKHGRPPQALKAVKPFDDRAKGPRSPTSEAVWFVNGVTARALLPIGWTPRYKAPVVLLTAWRFPQKRKCQTRVWDHCLREVSDNFRCARWFQASTSHEIDMTGEKKSLKWNKLSLCAPDSLIGSDRQSTSLTTALMCQLWFRTLNNSRARQQIRKTDFPVCARQTIYVVWRARIDSTPWEILTLESKANL